MSTLTFLMSHMVYFNNMKRNLGHIKVTQKPPQPMDYIYITYMFAGLISYACVNCYNVELPEFINRYIYM